MTDMEWIAVALYALAVLLDVVSTEEALSDGAREGNPLVAWLMGKLGRGWIVAKVAISAAVGWYLVSIGAAVWLLAPAAFLGWAAWHNVRLVR